ncbi:hypothetical protein O7634_22630 [Micromonospora sp. WMMD1120]|uniref:hypothetical protein n=1 Tax=Micromonospora sp. WMMD1120 TaxID=3016106 RepID=UPI0024177F32|nr:hypothetical protein [Micromonospora sp. WMMD1120]MDG4809554.1 hypothetical protein [Micromonospora sp. WMMD1120]
MHPIVVRVIRVLDWTTYDGWLWFDGYQLVPNGDAVARRTLFVMTSGLIWQDPSAFVGRKNARRPVARMSLGIG